MNSAMFRPHSPLPAARRAGACIRWRPLPSAAPSTASSPSLRGAKTAIGGGPVLVRNGKRQKIIQPASEAYEFSSMLERHPRTAVGWNSNYLFFVEVDGRQKNLSVGMTLDELLAEVGLSGAEIKGCRERGSVE